MADDHDVPDEPTEVIPTEPPPPFNPDLDLITTIDKGQGPRGDTHDHRR